MSIGWTTNEPATSRVSFGRGALTQTISDNALVTNHSVTLLDLAALDTYTYQVSSIDRAGNGPVSSAQAFFTTQPFPGDVTPPVITGGPSVASSTRRPQSFSGRPTSPRPARSNMATRRNSEPSCRAHWADSSRATPSGSPG